MLTQKRLLSLVRSLAASHARTALVRASLSSAAMLCAAAPSGVLAAGPEGAFPFGLSLLAVGRLPEAP